MVQIGFEPESPWDHDLIGHRRSYNDIRVKLIQKHFVLLIGNALEHLVGLMKGQGEAPLGLIQGYQQSYNDGARRYINLFIFIYW